MQLMLMNARRSDQRGLSLIESMIVVLIVALISALGGPALGEAVKRNRLRTQADRILATLNLVRSEAVKRNQSVSVCRSSTGTSCAGDWAQGWIIFANPDGDDTVDAGEEVIRVYEGLKPGYTLASTIGSSTLTYFSDGSYADGSGTIRVCSADQDITNSWSVMLNTVGRPRASKGTSVCP